MQGKTLKNALRELGFTQTEIASKLGISQQTFNSALGVDDVRTSLVENIAEVTGQPVGYFYGLAPAAPIASASGKGSTAVAGNGNQVNSTADKFLAEISAQRRMTEKSQDQIDRLLDIIDRLKPVTK